MKQKNVPKTIILFTEQDDDNVKRLSERLNKFTSSAQLIRVKSIDETEPLIRNSDRASTVLILVHHSNKTGESLLSLKQKGVLNDVRIILVLPETEESGLRKLLELGPSYISYLESDFDDVEAVMCKMGLDCVASF